MMKKIFLLVITLILLVSVNIYAAETGQDNSKYLILTLVNQTPNVLTYNPALNQNQTPNSTFTVIPEVIQPGTAAVVIGKTYGYMELFAGLAFKDTRNEDNYLIIYDPTLRHTKQPVFRFETNTDTSTVPLQIHNPNHDPFGLLIVGVTVIVKPKDPTLVQ